MLFLVSGFSWLYCRAPFAGPAVASTLSWRADPPIYAGGVVIGKAAGLAQPPARRPVLYHDQRCLLCTKGEGPPRGKDPPRTIANSRPYGVLLAQAQLPRL